MSASALQGTVTHARNPPRTPPDTYSVNTATAGTTASNEQLALFEKSVLQNGSLIHVTVLYFVNGRIGTYANPGPSRYLLEQSNTRQSLLRVALTPPAQQSPSKTRRSPKGGGAATNGRHRRHLADAGHGHAVVDFWTIDTVADRVI